MRKGQKVSAEIRAKISASKKGQKYALRTPEHCRAISEGKKKNHPYKGKSLPLWWRKKISVGGKGKILSEETRKKMSESAMGKKGTYGYLGRQHSEETKKQISLKKKGVKSSWETRLKIRKAALRGAMNPHWKGGVTPINKKIRNSTRMKDWRETIFKRDDWTCVKCKKRGGYLQADHIKPFALYSELRFKITNGRTLCKPCHTQTDSYLGNFNKNYNQSTKK